MTALGVLLERLAEQRERLAGQLIDLRDEAALEVRLIGREIVEQVARS